MKKILLSSAAVFAFAGAAAADVSWSGAATLGYNDDIKDGVYADVDLDVTLSQELNNGWTAKATFGWELADKRGPANAGGNDYVSDENIYISLSNDQFGIHFGATEFAAKSYWSGVTNMATDNFSERDGTDTLKLTASYGDIEGAVSYAYDDTQAAGDELLQLSLGAKATFGNFTAILAYQEAEATVPTGQDAGDWDALETIGITLKTSLGGADVMLSYSDDSVDNSIGIQATYPMGPVALTAFYVSESGVDDSYGIEAKYSDGPLAVKAWFHDGNDEDYGVDVSYDVGNGFTVYAGTSEADGDYIAAGYDLGGGASATLSWAQDDNNATNDEIGPKKYLHGTTVAVSFKF